MRRRCVSLGEVKCNECHNTIPYPDRYLAIEEENGIEVEEGATHRYCDECSLKKGYAQYKDEGNERVLTYFTD
jgi:hypothetical protein